MKHRQTEIRESKIDRDDEPDRELEETLRAKSRFHCAECQHCKTFRELATSGRYILKARCAKGHWRKKSKEDTCDLHRVSARGRSSCRDYESSSDNDATRREYLDDLEDLLPLERHIHEVDGSFVDKTETMIWDIENT